MATTPEGRYILVASSTGFVYLYDATVDDFVAGRQLFTVAPTGYAGPIAAGPNGQYFLLDGMLLNQALVQVATAPVHAVTLPTWHALAAGGQEVPTWHAAHVPPLQ